RDNSRIVGADAGGNQAVLGLLAEPERDDTSLLGQLSASRGPAADVGTDAGQERDVQNDDCIDDLFGESVDKQTTTAAKQALIKNIIDTIKPTQFYAMGTLPEALASRPDVLKTMVNVGSDLTTFLKKNLKYADDCSFDTLEQLLEFARRYTKAGQALTEFRNNESHKASTSFVSSMNGAFEALRAVGQLPSPLRKLINNKVDAMKGIMTKTKEIPFAYLASADPDAAVKETDLKAFLSYTAPRIKPSTFLAASDLFTSGMAILNEIFKDSKLYGLLRDMVVVGTRMKEGLNKELKKGLGTYWTYRLLVKLENFAESYEKAGEAAKNWASNYEDVDLAQAWAKSTIQLLDGLKVVNHFNTNFVLYQYVGALLNLPGATVQTVIDIQNAHIQKIDKESNVGGVFVSPPPK
ncbi:MAG: hypothetical protein HN348_23200, partial [Proteobacteria bacterium]|nr:hypothetical protein [Pseudomonadota bacterium]